MKNLINKIKNNDLSTRVLNAIVFGTGGAIIAKGLLMLFNIIVARIISTKDYGIYSLVNNTVQTFTVFAGAGLGATLSRYVALHRDKDKKTAGIIIKTLLIFNIIISIIVSLIMLIFSKNISDLISTNIDISIYLKITSLTIFFTSLSLILQNIMQGFEKYNKIAIIQLISNIILIVIGTLLTYFFRITGAIISLLLLNFIMTVLFFESIKRILTSEKIKLKYEMNTEVKEAIKNVAIPALLSSIFVVPVLWITNSVFTKYNGYDEFAAFSVCLQWFTILNFIPQQLGQVKPIYTQLYADNDIDGFKKISSKMIALSFCFSLIVSLVLMIASGFVLGLYGGFYTNYRLSFILMLIASVAFAIQSQFGSIFYAVGKIWVSFLLNIIWCMIFIGSFILLYKRGIIGYTSSYLISYTCYSIVSLIYFSIIIKQMRRIKND